ncbi:hypothetical protein J6590_078342 [Homalodisca vitripennis]|nr:hypothetical protein J6590_078342 [Homalodisca vitripennis]
MRLPKKVPVGCSLSHGIGVLPKDKREHKIPGNTLRNATVEAAKDRISSFPKYSSHYSRSQAPNRKPLLTMDNHMKKKQRKQKNNYICVKQKMPGNRFKMPKKRLKVIQVT